MKIGALTHPKTLDLAARLGVNRPTALGHLELLWHYCAQFTPQGNVGKYADGAIAGACDWTGDPQAFVGALVASGWIDPDPAHRLIVHDWPDHAPRWVMASLSRAHAPILRGNADCRADCREDYSGDYSRLYSGHSMPSVAMPSQEKPRESEGGTGGPDLNHDPGPFDDDPPEPATKTHVDRPHAPKTAQMPKGDTMSQNGKRSPGESVRQSRATRLPSDWQPDAELSHFAVLLGLDAVLVSATFRDYWHGAPGQKGVKADWPATWRNWCRREAQDRMKGTQTAALDEGGRRFLARGQA